MLPLYSKELYVFLLNVFNFKDKNNATFPEAVLLDFRAGYNRIGEIFSEQLQEARRSMMLKLMDGYSTYEE